MVYVRRAVWWCNITQLIKETFKPLNYFRSFIEVKGAVCTKAYQGKFSRESKVINKIQRVGNPIKPLRGTQEVTQLNIYGRFPDWVFIFQFSVWSTRSQFLALGFPKIKCVPAFSYRDEASSEAKKAWSYIFTSPYACRVWFQGHLYLLRSSKLFPCCLPYYAMQSVLIELRAFAPSQRILQWK